MFLFMIIVAILIVLSLFLAATIGIFGAGALIIFGDVIVCIVLLTWVIKKIFFNKKKQIKNK